MFNLFKKTKRVKAQIIDQATFVQEIINNKRPAIITFSAAWCGVCKMQKPLIDDLANTHKESSVLVGFVDIDQERELSGQFSIKSIPTTMMFKGGEPVFKKSGLLSRGNLEQLITKIQK